MGDGGPRAGNAVPISHRQRSKWIGNGLRELDRFLHHLLDAAAHSHGMAPAPRQRNSANKLHGFRHALGRSGDDHARLLALDGTRACLFYCDGILRSSAMAEACWTGLGRRQMLAPAEKGARLVILPADLQCVGEFYHGLADDLVRCPSIRPY